MDDLTHNNAFVKIHELSKVYSMGETTVNALDGVSLDIQPGSFTVIMGPSGSGKSTLLYLIGGLDWPTSGSITVDGEAIESMDENALAELGGLVRQRWQGYDVPRSMEPVHCSA